MTAGGDGGAETRDLKGGDAPSADPRRPRPGELFAGRYRIEPLLGEGGFGAVYAARDTALDRDVAIKILIAASDDGTILARFLQEAKAAAAMATEHVVTVHEVAVTHGVPYLVMERLRGRDLQDELQARGTLPIGEAVAHVLEACLGIAHAHAAGIVHRDLKPRNLFLAERTDGGHRVKVLDFGIAKAGGTDLTESGATLGTARYMAPEQLRSSRTVDARADIWALGVVLYELVSGRPIFDAASSAEFGVMILSDPHVPLRERAPAVPRELEQIVDRCLAKEPADRFHDVAALAQALAPFAADSDRTLVPRIERVLGAAQTRPREEVSTVETKGSRPSPAPSTARPRRGLVAGALLVGAVGIGLGAFVWSRSGTTTPGDAAPPADPPRDPVVATAPPVTPPIAPPVAIDAAPPVIAIDASVAAVPVDASAPATLDAAKPVTALPRKGVVFQEEVDEIERRCLKGTAGVARLINPGTRAGTSMECAVLADLGCVEIKQRCATVPITDAEKVLCRDFIARLDGACLTSGTSRDELRADPSKWLTYQLRRANTRCGELASATFRFTGKVISPQPKKTGCSTIASSLITVCSTNATNPALAKTLGVVTTVVCDYADPSGLPDPRDSAPVVTQSGSTLTIKSNLAMSDLPYRMTCVITRGLGLTYTGPLADDCVRSTR